MYIYPTPRARRKIPEGHTGNTTGKLGGKRQSSAQNKVEKGREHFGEEMENPEESFWNFHKKNLRGGVALDDS